jgi:hypothetical protein
LASARPAEAKNVFMSISKRNERKAHQEIACKARSARGRDS